MRTQPSSSMESIHYCVANMPGASSARQRLRSLDERHVALMSGLWLTSAGKPLREA